MFRHHPINHHDLKTRFFLSANAQRATYTYLFECLIVQILEFIWEGGQGRRNQKGFFLGLGPA